MVTFTSCSLFTRGPSEGPETNINLSVCPHVVHTETRLVLTLSGGAPAGDGALPAEGQRRRPDADGSDEPVEDQRLLQLHQGHVRLFGPGVVVVMVDDHGDADQLFTEETHQL